MNDDKIKSACDLLAMTTEQFNVAVSKVIDAETEIN